jgi:hypothetical protein
MKLAYLAFIAFLAGLTFLVLTIADQERQARMGVESIPHYQIALHRIALHRIALRSAPHADRSLMYASRSSMTEP